VIPRARRLYREAKVAGRGWRFASELPSIRLSDNHEPGELERYFDSQAEGIWKWRHYLPLYEQHLARFRGQESHLVEIGIMGGGSLKMWRDFLGCQIYGVDIDPKCRRFEGDGIRVFIGDQADPEFWRDFLSEVPAIDVVIDDGGHEAYQQIATFEALFPSIRPGGVYACEDIHHADHPFHAYLDGFTRQLSTMGEIPLQCHVSGVHRYPHLTVIEKPAST
jgi:hypothetical protein